MNRKIEILAPAGSFEAMKAAIMGGADAVYIGGQKFGARAFANNLNEEEMIQAIEYAHIYQKKIYLTINTLVKQDEMELLYDYLLPFYIHGLDAVIVQDVGVLYFVSENFPGLDIHASTQMTLTMAAGANLLKNYGVTRLVTSRELELEEIKEIREHTDLEIESFVHGALCYSYSGQCLMSSIIGGRSGNRGRCAQPCRMNYSLESLHGNPIRKNSSFLLSPKDMCTIYHIPELIESGIDSFKIEGRMKRPEYAAMTAHLYRKYTDLYLESGGKEDRKRYRSDLEKDMQKLMDLYNRGGFSDGYYFEHNGKKMMSMERPNHSGVLVGKVSKVLKNRAVIDLSENLNPQDVLEIRGGKEESVYEFTVKSAVDQREHYEANFKIGSRVEKGQKVFRTKNQSLLETIQKDIILSDTRIPVSGVFTGKKDEPVKLMLQSGNVKVTVIGEEAGQAVNQPVSDETIKKQLEKTKDTMFYFEKLEIDSTHDWFMPLGKINELRRQGFSELAHKMAEAHYRFKPEKRERDREIRNIREKDKPGITVSVMTVEQLEEAGRTNGIENIYIHFSLAEELEGWSIINEAKEKEKHIFLILPAVFRQDTWHKYEKKKSKAAQLLFSGLLDGAVVKNLEEIAFLKKREETFHGKIILDYNMYIMNDEAKKFWEEQEITDFTAPCELNSRELKQLHIENFEMIVYGYLPIMTSAQCVVKNTTGCSHKQGYYMFTDKNRNPFYGYNFCSCCYNVIYNGKPLNLFEHLSEVAVMKVKNIRLDFTMETRMQMKEIMNLYEKELYFGEKVETSLKEYTKGHFRRGIE